MNCLGIGLTDVFQYSQLKSIAKHLSKGSLAKES